MIEMNVLDNGHLQTPFGILGGVASHSCYESGEIRDVILNDKNMILTHVGELVPYYTETPRRKHKSSLSFHKNGLVKSVSLENQQEIVTPIGEFPAELVTFYETGELHRLFPLDGQISGFWTEKDEGALNIPFSFEFDFGAFSAMLVGICFYKSGNVKSITLFPGEAITLDLPWGKTNVKTGFSLFESGRLHTLEPAVPSPVNTPVGKINAFDAQANGITADSCSLCLSDEGKVLSLITSSDCIAVQTSDGKMKLFSPLKKISPLDDETEITLGMSVSFDYEKNTVTIAGKDTCTYCISDCGFNILSKA
ncbi:MAG: hypothetical protein WC900_05995, partial [Oscillospiraceae bacterium]